MPALVSKIEAGADIREVMGELHNMIDVMRHASSGGGEDGSGSGSGGGKDGKDGGGGGGGGGGGNSGGDIGSGGDSQEPPPVHSFETLLPVPPEGETPLELIAQGHWSWAEWPGCGWTGQRMGMGVDVLQVYSSGLVVREPRFGEERVGYIMCGEGDAFSVTY